MSFPSAVVRISTSTLLMNGILLALSADAALLGDLSDRDYTDNDSPFYFGIKLNKLYFWQLTPVRCERYLSFNDRKAEIRNSTAPQTKKSNLHFILNSACDEIEPLTDDKFTVDKVVGESRLVEIEIMAGENAERNRSERVMAWRCLDSICGTMGKFPPAESRHPYSVNHLIATFRESTGLKVARSILRRKNNFLSKIHDPFTRRDGVEEQEEPVYRSRGAPVRPADCRRLENGRGPQSPETGVMTALTPLQRSTLAHRSATRNMKGGATLQNYISTGAKCFQERVPSDNIIFSTLSSHLDRIPMKQTYFPMLFTPLRVRKCTFIIIDVLKKIRKYVPLSD
ncbi:hypothetical protein J6590_028645 [Homalodisca vitripennis]|nr:hypothetical protein J6590_028645 [Homalodisca vitripennis]